MKFAFRRCMLLVFVLAVAEIVWAAAAGFPTATRVIELPGTLELNVRLFASPVGSVLTVGLIVAVWRQVLPAYYIVLLIEILLACVLAIDLVASGTGPFTVALIFTSARLALLLRPSVRQTLLASRTVGGAQSPTLQEARG